MFERVIHQKRSDKGKVYWVYQPDTASMAKGKAHKKYEFGHQAGWITTSGQDMIITAIKTFEGHPMIIRPSNLYENNTNPSSVKPQRICVSSRGSREKENRTKGDFYSRRAFEKGYPVSKAKKETEMPTKSRHRTRHRTPQNTTLDARELSDGRQCSEQQRFRSSCWLEYEEIHGKVSSRCSCLLFWTALVSEEKSFNYQTKSQSARKKGFLRTD